MLYSCLLMKDPAEDGAKDGEILRDGTRRCANVLRGQARLAVLESEELTTQKLFRNKRFAPPSRRRGYRIKLLSWSRVACVFLMTDKFLNSSLTSGRTRSVSPLLLCSVRWLADSLTACLARPQTAFFSSKIMIILIFIKLIVTQGAQHCHAAKSDAKQKLTFGGLNQQLIEVFFPWQSETQRCS